MATTKVSTKLLETVGVAEGGTGATSASAARTSLGLGTVATLDTVSVATGGTGATSASAARTALGLVIGTNVLAPGGDGSSLTGIAGGATDAEAANIMLNAFRISVNGGLSVQNMVDGVVDEFEDETGVDTSTSTNETYDATGDFYSPSSSTNMTLVSNAATALAAPDDANIVIWQEDVDSVTLNTDLKAYASRDGGSTYTQITLSEDAAITAVGISSDRVPTMTSHTAPSGTVTTNYERSAYPAWKALDDNYGTSWDSTHGSQGGWIAYEFSSSKVISQYTLKSDDYNGQMAKSWTFEGWTGSAWVVLDTQTNSLAWGTRELRTFSISNTTSYIKYKLDVSIGHVYDQLRIGEWEMMGSLDISQRALSGSVDISGQSSGTSMKYKIETLNTKEQKIHAVALQWS